MDFMEQVLDARTAANSLKLKDTETRNNALLAMSEALLDNIDGILEANKIDLANAKDIPEVMVKRLELTKEKIISIAKDIVNVVKLDDPIGNILADYTAASGIRIQKISVPLGVIGVVYESRPNVSVDIATLCIKSGNACLLKGGKEAFVTNKKLVDIIQNAIKDYIDPKSVQLIGDNSREVVQKLITLRGYIDLVVPRGSKGLINYVTENTKVPYIETGAGVCHIYVDESADINMALKIIENAKLSNPAVCNAVECILVNSKVKDTVLTGIKDMFKDKVVLNGDETVKEVIDCNLIKDYGNEYDGLFLDLKVVDNLDEAISHIEKYGTHHSDAIISKNEANIEKFLNTIDSACVYVNASTRFSDGGCFGMGAELGISTQKLHARGPMALKEMTTYKYKIYGHGEIR
ncbi:MAG: glutamate-5-semialdehyde dehydrogenase [Acholeplasmatales bacterium]|nr:glutamate-5-semialdehyde dehydrogenase [Acholeplasmatales bacterium]